MTRDIAIEVLTDLQDGSAGECWLAETIADAIDRKIEDLHDALAMAIEALQTPPISQRSMYQAGYRQGREEALKGKQLDEWCYSCKEYDTEKKCCPRFNKVIREALKREPSEDGTLEVKVEDATKVGRVLISDDEHRGGLYYPDEDEPQKSYPTEWCEQCTLWEDNKCIGVAQCKSNIEALKHAMSEDLISRAEAIEAIELVDWYHQNSNKDMVSGAISDEHQAWYKAQDIYEALEAVPPADRPRGEWEEMGENKDGTHNIRCDQCGESFKARGHANSHNTKKKYRFCPSCGADMRGDTK